MGDAGCSVVERASKELRAVWHAVADMNASLTGLQHVLSGLLAGGMSRL